MSAPFPRAIQPAIADSLRLLAIDTEGMGLALCSDPAVAARHMEQLQAIDRISQSLRELARVLAASDPEAAIGSICLGDLREALEGSLAA
ncbi:hypothetical protein [Erythrobacter sp. HL-111]|uniref:hypothetical protein n=1 Tax=Erythrobacter sp. HL-111 TaxID=1798193 RepID=UPI0006DA558E|nr:hypothetical protein [Erythrobacter sp. HL-111]KPP96326.1 MAG: hypothetical protein HLUCCO15_01690 [Erythrobacteraceae bacterium HL-111]SDR73327.1 hypothetical protein SAMN04515621_0220 [Erythrobacter sp. HL-111]